MTTVWSRSIKDRACRSILEREMEHFKGQSAEFSHNRATKSAMSSCGWCPERFERDQLRSTQRKRGIGFVWNPNVHNSQHCLFTLFRVVCACRAVIILSVCLSVLVFCCPESSGPSDPVILSLSCQSHPQHESGPHQCGQPVFCICVCVWESRPDSAVHVNLFIRENAHELCVFVCVSMTQRDSGA